MQRPVSGAASSGDVVAILFAKELSNLPSVYGSGGPPGTGILTLQRARRSEEQDRDRRDQRQGGKREAHPPGDARIDSGSIPRCPGEQPASVPQEGLQTVQVGVSGKI